MKKLLIGLLIISSIASAMEKIAELTTKQVLTETIKSHSKLIICFLGTCEHCLPGLTRFEKFVESEESNLIKYFKIYVADKPEILEEYNIKNKPTIHAYIDNALIRTLERDQISAENLKELAATMCML